MNNSYRSAERVAPPVHMPSIQESIYHTLLYTVFQRPSQRDSAGMVVALTSTNPREGVSYVTRALVRELAKCETNSVAQVHARFLGRFYEPTAESFHQSLTRSALRPARNACEMGPINALPYFRRAAVSGKVAGAIAAIASIFSGGNTAIH